MTQHRVVLEHLDAIRDRLLEIAAGTASADRNRRAPVGDVGTAVAERAT